MGNQILTSLLTNLIDTRKKLMEEFETLTFEQMNKKPKDDRWSISQVCHHLVLVERSTVKVIAWGLKNGPGASSVERVNVQKILDRTQKVNAPSIVEPTDESFEVENIKELLVASRTKLRELLQEIQEPSILETISFKHPALGDLPLDQWIQQIYLHEQRHIEQIKEIKSELGIAR